MAAGANLSGFLFESIAGSIQQQNPNKCGNVYIQEQRSLDSQYFQDDCYGTLFRLYCSQMPACILARSSNPSQPKGQAQGDFAFFPSYIRILVINI